MMSHPPEASPPVLLEEIHLALINSLSEGLCFVDRKGRVRVWNSAAESITGISQSEAFSAPAIEAVFACCDTNGIPLSHAPIRTALDHDRQERLPLFLRHKEGHQMTVEVRSFPVHGEGHILGAAALFHRVSDTCTLSDQQEEADGAWWTANDGESAASTIEAQLERRLQNRESHGAGLLLIGIDELAKYEQQLGHEAVKKLFGMVRKTVESCLDSGDSCNDWEDHSIVALMDVSSLPPLLKAGERIRSLVQASGVLWWGEMAKITVTIAAIVAQGDDTWETLLARLREASTKGREQGGNSVLSA